VINSTMRYWWTWVPMSHRSERSGLIFGPQFDAMGPADVFQSDSEDEDESLTVPKPSFDDLVGSSQSLYPS